jgi:hypothetical protein
MSLLLYKYDPLTNSYTAISQSTFTNPIRSNHDGLKGEIVEQKLFIRNNDGTLYYTDVVITPTALSTNINSGTSWLVKLYNGNDKPSDWSVISSGASITLDDIGSVSSGDTNYKPFWLYIKAPQGTKATTIDDISLTIDYSTGTVI